MGLGLPYHRVTFRVTVPYKNHTWGFDLAGYTGNKEGSNRGFVVCMVISQDML